MTSVVEIGSPGSGNGIQGVSGGKVWGYKKGTQDKQNASPTLRLVLVIFAYAAISVGLFLFGRTAPTNYIPEQLDRVVLFVFLYAIVSPVLIIGPLFAGGLISKLFTRKFNLNKRNAKAKEWGENQFFSVFFLIFAIFITGIFFGTDDPVYDEVPEQEQAYMSEYGYTDVGYAKGDTTSATTKDGEKIRVHVMIYEDQIVLYENSEQLREKMDSIDAGTYAKGLGNEE